MVVISDYAYKPVFYFLLLQQTMSENLLVAAKSEYTEQLQEILCENIYNGIKTIWNSCKEVEKVNTLKCFQRKLCAIPEWNQEIINKIFKTIIASMELTEDYIDKIIEAVFLSNVKILSVVKSNNKSQKINVSIPDTKHFVHKCYIESARAFYTDPFLVDDRGHITQSEVQRNVGRSISIIKLSIEKTIRAMIPMEEILKKYLENQEDTYEADYSDRKSDDHNEHIEPEIEPEQEQDVDDIFNEPPQPQEDTQPTPPQPYGPFMEQPIAESPFPRVPTPEPQAYYGPHVEPQPVSQAPPPQQTVSQQSPHSPLVVNLGQTQTHNDNENFFD